MQRGDGGAGPRRRRGSRAARTPTMSAPGSTIAAPIWRPGRRGCGRRPRMIDAVDVLFVDEAGQISLANVVAISRATRQPRPAGRPAAARPAAEGIAPAGRRPLGPRPRPRRAGDDAARSRPVPRDDLAAPSRRCARSPPRSSTTTGSSRSRTSPSSDWSPQGAVIGDGVGPRLLDVPTVGRGQRIAGRGGRGRPSRPLDRRSAIRAGWTRPESNGRSAGMRS